MATIGSGVRYDLFLNDNVKFRETNEKYFHELLKFHVSGRLKVAPEHTSENVLKLMRKPSFRLFEKLKILFDQYSRKEYAGLQLIPYFISSHPGCQNTDMAELAAITKNLNFKLEQVQDFTPTPLTLAEVMYYTGENPFTGEKVFTAHTKEEKEGQRKYFFWYKREFRNQIYRELEKAGRKDLIEKLFGKYRRK
jgi:uncharacterized radical SAM protein YgiQ